VIDEEVKIALLRLASNVEGGMYERAYQDRPTTIYVELMRIAVHVHDKRRLRKEACRRPELGNKDKDEGFERGGDEMIIGAIISLMASMSLTWIHEPSSQSSDPNANDLKLRFANNRALSSVEKNYASFRSLR
jgi:hypothetical protein